MRIIKILMVIQNGLLLGFTALMFFPLNFREAILISRFYLILASTNIVSNTLLALYLKREK